VIVDPLPALRADREPCLGGQSDRQRGQAGASPPRGGTVTSLAGVYYVRDDGPFGRPDPPSAVHRWR
jgi:hypothetical protein